MTATSDMTARFSSTSLPQGQRSMYVLDGGDIPDTFKEGKHTALAIACSTNTQEHDKLPGELGLQGTQEKRLSDSL